LFETLNFTHVVSLNWPLIEIRILQVELFDDFLCHYLSCGDVVRLILLGTNSVVSSNFSKAHETMLAVPVCRWSRFISSHVSAVYS